MLSMASWRGSASGSANRHDLQVVDAPANGQHSPHPFISDDARQRRPDRIYTLDEIQVIHVDRRMLDTDQHLAYGRCWRFGRSASSRAIPGSPKVLICSARILRLPY